MINKRCITRGATDKISHVEDKLVKKRSTRKKESDDDFDSSKSLEDYGVWFLSDEIDNNTASDAIKYILEANLDPNCHWKYITMIINSPGGYVTDGFALIDIMNGSRIPIRTVGIGLIGSMALQVFLTGEKGTRTLTPNTMILSHQYDGGAFGKEHELVAAQTEHKQTSEIIMRHYQRTTGLSEEDIRKYLLPPSDVWLTAKDAKRLGVCDVIKDIQPRQIAQKTKKKK